MCPISYILYGCIITSKKVFPVNGLNWSCAVSLQSYEKSMSNKRSKRRS